MNEDSGGKFRIFGWPRARACFRTKARLMRVTSWQEDKQTEKTAAELPENEENLKRFNVSMGFKLTYRLKKSLLRTAKGRSALRHQEKQRANRNKKIKMQIKMRRWSQNPQSMEKQ